MTALALALATTVKHDGHGGITDLLSTPQDATAWLADHEHLVAHILGPTPAADAGLAADSGLAADAGLAAGSGLGRFMRPNRQEILPNMGAVLRGELLGMRGAVRALFARAVAPGPPSKADADRLMDVEAALRVVNEAAARLGTTQLEWRDGELPVTRWAPRTEDPLELLLGAVARSTIEFLTGPDRERLRACPAARCVKYFLQDDPRQTWCSPACGNRERVNRHYRKRTAG